MATASDSYHDGYVGFVYLAHCTAESVHWGQSARVVGDPRDHRRLSDGAVRQAPAVPQAAAESAAVTERKSRTAAARLYAPGRTSERRLLHRVRPPYRHCWSTPAHRGAADSDTPRPGALPHVALTESVVCYDTAARRSSSTGARREQHSRCRRTIIVHKGAVHYAKIHVHESETPYFLPGEDSCVVSIDGTCVGVAICADTGHASDAATVAARGAQLYVASVMKTDAEILDHARKMKQRAMSHRMAALTANYAGSSGRRQSAGKTAFWDERGHLVARVEANDEALLVARSKMGHWHGEILTFR